MLIAAVLWSTSAFFSKAPIFVSWPESVRPSMLVFWRAVFASAILLVMVRRPTWSWRMLPMLIAFAAMNYTFLTAMVRAEAAAVIWLQMTSPAWIFLGSAFLFRERIVKRDWLMLACAMIGVCVILGFGLRGESPWVMTLGLLSGVFYACVVLSLRGLRHHDAAWLIALNHLVTAAVFLPVVLTQGVMPTPLQFGFVAAFGMFQMGVPYVLFARGVKHIGGHEASGIGLIEPVLVPIWVYMAWRHAEDYEAPQWWTLIGGSMILVGLALRYVDPRWLGFSITAEDTVDTEDTEGTVDTEHP